MKRIARYILKGLPRRRERRWRYISPHRRGAGAVILALLTVAVAAYWVLPFLLDGWTRQQAAEYLRSVTGGTVRVDGASFSLFGGIKLVGVSIDVPDSPLSERFFQADAVVLHHRPWSLLTRGRLEPTELVCIEPTVTLGYDAEKGRYTIEDLIAAARRQQAARRAQSHRGRLPVISIRDVHLRMLTGDTRLNISMVPVESGYRITLAEGQPGEDPICGTWVLSLRSGEMRLVEGKIPKIATADRILPARYAKWRKRYDIQGNVGLRGKPGTAPAKAILEAELDDVSLQLQKAEGGLELVGVHGTLTFHEDGVEATDLTGRIAQAGNALFRMSGRYGGYDANSPFDLRIDVEGLSLPDSRKVTGWLADTLTFLRETFRPTGTLDISAKFRRLEDGRIALEGAAEPHGMTFLYRRFPYRIERAVGAVRFVTKPSEDRVYLTSVTGRRGAAEIAIEGTIDLRPRGRYDVTVTGKNVPLDAEMRAALPERYRAVWDRFRPSGTTDAKVRVRKEGPGKSQHVQLTLSMDGNTSMCYEGFPYRLNGLSGELRADGPSVTLDSLRGRRGAMRCTIDGTLVGLGGAAGQTHLTIEATDVPLDANLVAALPTWVRKEAASLHTAGLARRVSATIRKPKDGPYDYRVVARVEGAAFKPDALPYGVADANGLLTIRPGRVIVEELSGRHGKTPIGVTGQVLVGRDKPALDLRIRGRDVALNAELLAALPPGLQRLWRKLAPRGRADVDLALRRGMPDTQRAVDYRLVLDAKGMQVRYEDFPYTLSDVVGRAVATPDGVTLRDVTATHGSAKLRVDGEVSLDPNGEAMDLRVVGTNVPIDRELLAAVPASLAPLGKRFRPGGRCDLDLKRFWIRRPPAPGAGPADTRPAVPPAPTTRPSDAPSLRWSAEGRVAFRDATVDLGLGHKTLSGTLSGAAAQTGKALAVKADIQLDSVQVGRQRLTQLRGRLTKDPRSQLLRLDDMFTKAHGGQITGFAEVRLSDPLAFGVSLSVDGIRLEDLLKGSGKGPKAADVRGRLTGNVQLTATAGTPPRRQASGVLEITEGKLYKLPVMLGLLHVVYLTLPGETAFQGGTITYHLRNDTLVFDEIYLRGLALSLVGSGTMNMKTEKLDLLFLSGPPRKLPRLGSLTELLEGIAREVAQIHVAGTLQKPRMRTVPLRRLDRLLRDMLNPGRDK